MSLTTHVLDISQGRPAAGVAITLTRVSDGVVLAEALTNADGRTDTPLAPELPAGEYELVFAVGDYFGRGGKRPFLGDVPVRFGIADAAAHYHVPLLVSPWAYSTYRGS